MKFKVLMGARQCGHTKMLKDMIKTDLSSGLEVGIACNNQEFNKLKVETSVDLGWISSSLSCSSSRGRLFDKVYILNFEYLNDADMDEVKFLSKDCIVHCHKPMLKLKIQKKEFEVARQLRKNDDVLNSQNLFDISRYGLDVSKIEEYYNSKLTRPDVELVIHEPHCDIFSRLRIERNNDVNLFGIIFEQTQDP